MMDKKDIIEVANSFKTYEEMYELLNNGDFSFLSRELNTNVDSKLSYTPCYMLCGFND